MVSIRIPNDVIEDLKRIAPLLGFSGYQSLIKRWIDERVNEDIEILKASKDLQENDLKALFR